MCLMNLCEGERACCIRCGMCFGEKIAAKGFSLLRHRILCFNAENDDEMPCSQFSVNDFVASEISRAIEVERCYRMKVEADIDGYEKCLFLKIVSHEAWISFDADVPPIPAIKLVFSENKAELVEKAEMWSATRTLSVSPDEYMSFRRHICEISSLLKVSSIGADFGEEGFRLTYIVWNQNESSQVLLS
mmetsp:Transcript_5865/g.8802  ORF Transcript_5865/g.8802 Transcript_5865/m.8802 type:complete len:189 (-) Transcript_5865:118-684(-)